MDSVQCFPTLPRSGSMRSGRVSVRPMSARRIAGKGSSFWPTAMTEDAESSGSRNYCDRRGSETLTSAARKFDYQKPLPGEKGNAYWERMAEYEKAHGITPEDLSEGQRWPTPNTRDASSPGRHTTQTGVMHPGTSLTDVMREWQTPSAGRYEKRRQVGQTSREELLLPAQAEQWQTPGTDSFRGRGGDRKDEAGLDRQARMWSPPNARDWKGEDIPGRNGSPSLPAQVMRAWPTANAAGGTGYRSGSNRDTWRPTLEGAALGLRPSLHDPTIQKVGADGSPQGARPRLNAAFVEALMGFPRGWSSCAPLETPSFPPRPPSPSESSLSELEA